MTPTEAKAIRSAERKERARIREEARAMHAVCQNFGSSEPPPKIIVAPPKFMKRKARPPRLIPQMGQSDPKPVPQPEAPRSTTDTEVRQSIQDAVNTVMRWHRLEETSAKYRSESQRSDLTKFFRKATFEVWVDNEGRPLLTPEDSISILIATAGLILSMDVMPDKARAFESAVKKGREK